MPIESWLAWFEQNWSEALEFLPVAIPLALATVVGGIDCTESASAAGDDYPTGTVIGVEGLATLVGGLFGGVIQSTPYIGHPAYKAMGARAGYTLATALFVGAAGVFGYFGWIFTIIPKAAIFPILIFVGLEITAQSFRATPSRHLPALGLACVPALAYLAYLIMDRQFQAAGKPFSAVQSRHPAVAADDHHAGQRVHRHEPALGHNTGTSDRWPDARGGGHPGGRGGLRAVRDHPLSPALLADPAAPCGDRPAEDARAVRGVGRPDPLPLDGRLWRDGRRAPDPRLDGPRPLARSGRRATPGLMGETAMNADELRALQEPIKAHYRDDPSAARVTFRAEGTLDPSAILCRVETTAGTVASGLHPMAGGDGQSACSGDMLLQSLVACAGVTLRAVATALGVELRGGTIRAEGQLDFRGTLGVRKDVPIGITDIRLLFDLDTDATPEQLQTLLKLTERYCVIYQTLRNPPTIQAEILRPTS